MRPFLALLILIAAAPVCAQDEEDAAHRADRLRTQELNSRSSNGYARGGDAGYGHGLRPDAGDRGRQDYAQAQAEYRQRLADWRRRVAACESGYYEACQR